jgi:hypothetical protein
VRIGDDPAPRLTENLGQAYDQHRTGGDDIGEDQPGPTEGN